MALKIFISFRAMVRDTWYNSKGVWVVDESSLHLDIYGWTSTVSDLFRRVS